MLFCFKYLNFFKFIIKWKVLYLFKTIKPIGYYEAYLKKLKISKRNL